MIIDNSKLQFSNPWWDNPTAINQDKKLKEFEDSKFKYYHPLYNNLPKQDVILTIRGPRQVGKTTLIKLLIQKILDNHTPASNVFYYSCDLITDFQTLHNLLTEYLQALRADNQSRAYIFLDEISFVDQWPRTIKALADAGQLDQITLCFTGSNILDPTHSGERLPGRRGDYFKPDIDYLPLTFREFLQLTAPKLAQLNLEQANLELPKLRQKFRDYLTCGGFPKTINEYHQLGYLKTSTYETYLKWIEGDLHKTDRSEQTAYKLLKRIIISYSSPLSYHKLAKESGLASYTTAYEYLEILEKMFVVQILPFFNLDQKRPDNKKNKKIYLADPFIRNAVWAQTEGFLSQAFDYSQKKIITPDRLPTLVEEVSLTNLSRNFVANYYGKSGDKEIDWVGFNLGQYSGMEVKYQNQVQASEFNWVQKLSLTQPFAVLTKQNLQRTSSLHLIPAEVYLGIMASK